MATRASISAQADATLLKEITKLIHRIERILVPINSLVHSTIGERLDQLIVQIKKGEYFENVNKFPVEDLIGYDVRSIEPLFRKVSWGKLELDIWNTVSDGDSEYRLPDAVIVEIATERQVHEDKLERAASKERVRRLQVCAANAYLIFRRIFTHVTPSIMRLEAKRPASCCRKVAKGTICGENLRFPHRLQCHQ